MSNKFKAFIWVSVIFVAGILFGGAVALRATRHLRTPPSQRVDVSVDEPLQSPEEVVPPEPAPDPRPSTGEPSHVRAEQPPDTVDLEPQDSPPAIAGEGRILRRMLLALDLDPRQRRAVRRVLANSLQQRKQAERAFRENQQQIRQDALRQLRQILRPAQERRLNQFLANLEQRQRRQRR